MIHGRFVPKAGGAAAPWVSVGISADQGETWVGVDFLVDTGADATVIHPADAARVFPDYSSRDFSDSLRMGGIGGSSVYLPTTIDIQLLDDAMGALTGSLAVLVAPPSSVARPLPSLLGRDVIGLFRFVCDAPAGVVTFEVSGQW